MAEKILLVDDDHEFRGELKEMLDGYDVVEASSGREALNLLKRANNINLVILDVMMPGLSGTEVLREIKKTDPFLGIIILTGYSSKDIAIEALKARADDYIEKPLDSLKIKEIIARVIGNRHSQDHEYANDIESKIDKVNHFIEANCFKKFSLKDAADVVCLSPKYLSRVYRRKTGKSFSDYKLKIKIRKAKELLINKGYNVNQVSDKLGYENAESFIRMFKKITAYTPAAFCRKNIK